MGGDLELKHSIRLRNDGQRDTSLIEIDAMGCRSQSHERK
jgi:DNA relaxase NicK